MSINVVDLLGVVGGICFAYCGVPAAYATLKAKRSVGTPVSIAWMIFVGAVAMYFYLLATYGFNLLLTANYSVEALSWGIVVYFHYFPQSKLNSH